MYILSKKIIKSKKEEKFFNHYQNIFFKTLDNVDINNLKKISQIIENKIKKNKKIFVAGNGGSASVANHFLCDFNKGIKSSSKKKLVPQIISLSNSLELITAIGNDLDFSEIFSYQLENYAQKNDLLITFSCSGTSKNILKVINSAKLKKMQIISFNGFGKISKKVNYGINLKCKNYGITEDIFSYFMHTISQFIRSKFDKNNVL